MTDSPAACAYLAEITEAYADYESEITRATAGAGARWHRKIRRAARRYERATAINGGTEMTARTNTIRALTATTAGAAFLAASVASAAVPASASAQAARCRTGQIAVTLEHPVRQGGNQGWTIGLQDKGNAACTVSGYPRLGLEGRHGQRLRSITQDGPTYFHADPAPSSVILQPGGFAVAWLAYGTVSGSGNVRARALTIRTEGAASHKTVILASRSVTITRGVLDVTAWKLRKG